MLLAPPATIRTRGLPITKRLLCQLSYKGLGIHFGCAHTRASRRMWCLAARDLGLQGRAHPAPPTPCRVATECMGTPEVARMGEHIGRGCILQPRSGRSPASAGFAKPRTGQGRVGYAPSCERTYTGYPALRSIDRWLRAGREPVGCGGKQKGPDPCGFRASANRVSRARIYALASPGCIWLSFHSSLCRHGGNAGCMTAPQVPADFIAAAHANATRPALGRLRVVVCLEFTIRPILENAAMKIAWKYNKGRL